MTAHLILPFNDASYAIRSELQSLSFQIYASSSSFDSGLTLLPEEIASFLAVAPILHHVGASTRTAFSATSAVV